MFQTTNQFQVVWYLWCQRSETKPFGRTLFCACLKMEHPCENVQRILIIVPKKGHFWEVHKFYGEPISNNSEATNTSLAWTTQLNP